MSGIPAAAIGAAAASLVYEQSSGMCQIDRVCELCDCGDPKTGDAYARLHARKALEAAWPHLKEST